MKIRVWTVSTCEPDHNEPTPVHVFGSKAAAEAHLDAMMRAEWDTHMDERPLFASDAERSPYPGDWKQAHEIIAAEREEWENGLDFDRERWGRWSLEEHEIEIGQEIRP